MPILTRNGVNIFYEVSGSGPVLLLTHGFSADHNMWTPQIPALSENYSVVTWDMRGHGQTDSPDDLSFYNEYETVEDIAALIDEMGADRAIIGGMSLGGYMSLSFIQRYPHRVRGLLLVDTGPGFKNDEARAKWNDTAVKRGEEIDSMDASSFAGRTEAMAAKHRDFHGVANAARGMLVQNDGVVIFSLPDIAVPTLVVVGDRDEPYLVPSDYMAKKIPNAEKVVIPDAGHAANMDQPEIFNREVLEFLSRRGL